MSCYNEHYQDGASCSNEDKLPVLRTRKNNPASRKRGRSPIVDLVNLSRKRVHHIDSALGYDDEENYANGQDNEENFSDDSSIVPNGGVHVLQQYQEWDDVSLFRFRLAHRPPVETVNMKERRGERERQIALEEQHRTRSALYDISNPLRTRYSRKRNVCLRLQEALEDAKEEIERLEQQVSELFDEKEQLDIREFNHARDRVEEVITIDHTAIRPNLKLYTVDVKRNSDGLLAYEQRYEYST